MVAFAFLSLFTFPVLAQPTPQPEETLTLPPIIKSGSAADVLTEDPVLPTRKIPALPSGTSGSPTRSYTMSQPTPVLENNQPGGFSQVKGFGRSSEDLNVMAFGVPLNSPQGGG